MLALPAQAAPVNPSDADLTAARSAQDQAAAEVGRLTAMVATAESQLQQANVVAEAAADAQLVAEAELASAQQAADAADAELVRAASATAAAADRVNDVGRENYMRSAGELGVVAGLLDAGGPSQLLQQAATLDYLAAGRLSVLHQLRVAQIEQANAAALAQAAAVQRQDAADAAAEATDQAQAQLAQFQTRADAAAAERDTYQQQLQAAQIQLLQLQGERDAYAAWQAQQAAAARAEAARQATPQPRPTGTTSPRPPGTPTPTPVTPPMPVGSSGAVAPTTGRFTTCYEMRWGVMHNGVDIAAPIGTPIYSPLAGTVRRAGSATGFGLAVYIEHDDGSVTVYGHINDYFVTAGQRVDAGEVIAVVGNTGQSTGPHLHFEVHTDGMYAGRVNPMPWLAARGVTMPGRCS
ncbi:peptidoglycan DD-metalloendopeptidase family protein [Klenkia sp. PcliD-1-E]|uniref:peptidoglycan DD-metalloendopeptidase family protein n=1 Tax=Klenkia sp. PcliD-1-E TaxID=2954492 RepID=UPI0020981D22|nr:peptidoglycan DD-metalloendopeptidase family protein [Klenkia sp. PcliD-1-E]MCO7220424.1 M23 family metallopeptidase [Klenkia sp. PcliD-1-E]